MASMGSNNAYLHGEPVLALGPEHAAILARDGLSKDDVRRYLWQHARIPRAHWESGGMYGMTSALTDAFSVEPALRCSATPRPDDHRGRRRRTPLLLDATFGAMTKSVTRAITLADGTPVKTFKTSGGLLDRQPDSRFAEHPDAGVDRFSNASRDMIVRPVRNPRSEELAVNMEQKGYRHRIERPNPSRRAQWLGSAARNRFASACRSFHPIAPFLSTSGRNSQNVSP